MFSPTIAVTALLIELLILLFMAKLLISLHPRVLHNLKEPAARKDKADGDIESGRGDGDAVGVRGNPYCYRPEPEAGLGVRVVEEA